MAEKSLEVEIVTPAEKIYSGEAFSISVPGALSPFEILYNHAPIVSALDIGIVKINDISNKKITFAVNSGFVEVKNNKVSILVEAAINSEMINIEEVNSKIMELNAKISTAPKTEHKEIKQGIASFENMLKAVK